MFRDYSQQQECSVAWLSLLLILLANRCIAAEPSAATAGALPVIDPTVWLIRAPTVQTELRLDAQQQRRMQQLLVEFDPQMWLLRDVSPEQSDGAERWQAVLEKLHGQLDVMLEEAQRTRLRQLVVQAQGTTALRKPGFAGQLQLTPSQREAIGQIMDETAQQLRSLQPSEGGDPDALREQVTQLRTREQLRVLELITPEQRARWIQLRGEVFDLSRVGWTGIYAPELKHADQWINSAPLSLEGLRGQVVAVHFWTFGCINCIHNYPSYKAWQSEYASRGLTIIGIHTPETEGEHDIQRVRQKAIDNDLRFPIAIDNQLETWTAWANRIWPSVYLIDKQGRIRYWWYGELNWQGAEGDKKMRQRIEELLAEQ